MGWLKHIAWITCKPWQMVGRIGAATIPFQETDGFRCTCQLARELATRLECTLGSRICSLKGVFGLSPCPVCPTDANHSR